MSIHTPFMSTKASTFSSVANSSVSKRLHLAGGSGLSFDGLAANNPAHGGIASQTVGVVHIVIAAKAPENGLAKLTRHAVPSVLAGTAILETTLGHLSQAEGIVKLPVGEQPGIRGDLGTVEFQASIDGQKRPEGIPVSIHPLGVPYPAAPCMLQLHDSYSRIAFSPH